MAFELVAKLKVLPDEASLAAIKKEVEKTIKGASAIAVEIKVSKTVDKRLEGIASKIAKINEQIADIPAQVSKAVSALANLNKTVNITLSITNPQVLQQLKNLNVPVGPPGGGGGGGGGGWGGGGGRGGRNGGVIYGPQTLANYQRNNRGLVTQRRVSIRGDAQEELKRLKEQGRAQNDIAKMYEKYGNEDLKDEARAAKARGKAQNDVARLIERDAIEQQRDASRTAKAKGKAANDIAKITDSVQKKSEKDQDDIDKKTFEAQRLLREDRKRKTAQNIAHNAREQEKIDKYNIKEQEDIENRTEKALNTLGNTRRSRRIKGQNQSFSRAPTILKNYGQGKQVSPADFQFAQDVFGVDLSAGATNIPATGRGGPGRVINSNFYRPPTPQGSNSVGFGSSIGLAFKRAAAFAVATGPAYGAVSGTVSGARNAIEFERELIKVAQTIGKTKDDVLDFGHAMQDLSVKFGINAVELVKAGRVFAQAGFNAGESKELTRVLGLTQLSPSFGSTESTQEGMVAILQQFGKGQIKGGGKPIDVADIEGVMGSISRVAAEFAVESEDIVQAIKRTGSIFAATSPKGTSSNQILREMVTVFSSIRATTRLPAESIATGMKTTGALLQRQSTQDVIKNELGVNLRDEKGQFIGIYEALNQVTKALQSVPSTDAKYARVIEALGGTRHFDKLSAVLEHFQEFSGRANLAYMMGGGELERNKDESLKGIGKQFDQLFAKFNQSIEHVFEDENFRTMIKFVLMTGDAFASLLEVIRPLTTLFTLWGGSKLISAIGGTAVGRSIVGPINQFMGRPASGIGPPTGHWRWGSLSPALLPGAGIAGLLGADAIDRNYTPQSSLAAGLKGGGIGAAEGGITAKLLGFGTRGTVFTALAYAAVKATHELDNFAKSLLEKREKELAEVFSVAEKSGKGADYDVAGKNLLDFYDEKLKEHALKGEYESKYGKAGFLLDLWKMPYNAVFNDGMSEGDINEYKKNSKDTAKGIAPQALAYIKSQKKRFELGDFGDAEFQKRIERHIGIIREATGHKGTNKEILKEIGIGDVATIKAMAATISGIEKMTSGLEILGRTLEKTDEIISETANVTGALTGSGRYGFTRNNRADLSYFNPDLGNRINSARRLRDYLPEGLAWAMKGVGGKDVTEDEFKANVKSGINKDYPGLGFGEAIIQAIEDKGENGMKFDEIRKGINGNRAKLGNEIFDSSVLKPLIDAGEKFNAAYQKVALEIIQSMKNYNSKLMEVANVNTGIVQKRAGLSEFVTGLASRPFDIESEIQKGFVRPGVNGMNPNDLFEDINKIKTSLRMNVEAQGNLPINSPEYKTATDNIQILTGQLDRTKAALSRLADSSELLNQIQQKRVALEDYTAGFLSKTPVEQAKTLQRLSDAANLISQGKGLDEVPSKRASEIVAALREAGQNELNLPGIQGMTGASALSKLLRNGGDLPGFPGLNGLFGQEAQVRGNQLGGAEAIKKILLGEADVEKAGGDKIKGAMDKAIADALKKGGLGDAALFAAATKTFDETTKKFSDAVEMMTKAKIELTVAPIDIKLIGADVFAGMDKAVTEIVKSEIVKALNAFAAKRLKGIGVVGPGDIAP